MIETKRMRLEIHDGARAAEIPLAGSGIPWRARLSLHAAGHMGRETEERRENRTRFFRSVGVESGRVFGVTQVHGRDVLEVDGRTPDDCASVQADGLVSDGLDAVLSVTVADCLPIMLFAPGKDGRAIVHSGWKGTGIVARAVGELSGRYGIAPGAVDAVIGPGIGSCCYEVDRERYERFTAEFGPGGSLARDGTWRLDLRAANVMLLESIGIRSVTVVDNCTCCEHEFGSYRRDGRDRFHNMIVLFGAF
ncbi:MAG: polyphenol oxidase family protein [Spirochaetales bacterium]|nr:polyphenol oxidase family protein [Spirochaetales bacterium]